MNNLPKMSIQEKKKQTSADRTIFDASKLESTVYLMKTDELIGFQAKSLGKEIQPENLGGSDASTVTSLPRLETLG